MPMYYNGKEVIKITKGDVQLRPKVPEITLFRFKALAEDSVITPVYTNGGTLQYSADGNTRTTVSSGGSFTVPTGEVRYMRGYGHNSNALFTSSSISNARTISKPVECHGNINELLDYTSPPTTLANYCYYYMFRNCSSLTTAPELPATTLANYCYSNMFSGCSSLTTPPELPATTLTSRCYQYMFDNCSSLKVSSSQTGSYQYPRRIPTSGTGTTATYWNRDMLRDTGGTFTSNPYINTTYYVENQPV